MEIEPKCDHTYYMDIDEAFPVEMKVYDEYTRTYGSGWFKTSVRWLFAKGKRGDTTYEIKWSAEKFKVRIIREVFTTG